MPNKNKLKFLRIFLLSLIVLASLSLTINITHKSDSSYFKKNNLNTNLIRNTSNNNLLSKHFKTSNINDLIIIFPWLKKYKNDKDFANRDFNAYVNGDLIKKALIDEYLLQVIIALKEFKQYILNTYTNLKFAYKILQSNYDYYDSYQTIYYWEKCDVVFNPNYFAQWQQIEWDDFLDKKELKFYPKYNVLVQDLYYCFLANNIEGIYYTEEKDKNSEDNEVNKKVKDKIKQLKTEMNHVEKQLRVFHHSLSQPTLQLNDEISELNNYLAKMVVKKHKHFDHTAVNKEIYDKSISEILIENNIRNLFFVWIKNFDISDSLAYEDLPWFMCKHDDFFSYLTFHKKKYANGENIDFKSAITDFLSLVKSNYTITTFENINKKKVISFDFEDWFSKYGPCCMKWLVGITIIFALFYALFYVVPFPVVVQGTRNAVDTFTTFFGSASSILSNLMNFSSNMGKYSCFTAGFPAGALIIGMQNCIPNKEGEIISDIIDENISVEEKNDNNEEKKKDDNEEEAKEKDDEVKEKNNDNEEEVEEEDEEKKDDNEESNDVIEGENNKKAEENNMKITEEKNEENKDDINEEEVEEEDEAKEETNNEKNEEIINDTKNEEEKEESDDDDKIIEDIVKDSFSSINKNEKKLPDKEENNFGKISPPFEKNSSNEEKSIFKNNSKNNYGNKNNTIKKTILLKKNNTIVKKYLQINAKIDEKVHENIGEIVDGLIKKIFESFTITKIDETKKEISLKYCYGKKSKTLRLKNDGTEKNEEIQKLFEKIDGLLVDEIRKNNSENENKRVVIPGDINHLQMSQKIETFYKKWLEDKKENWRLNNEIRK